MPLCVLSDNGAAPVEIVNFRMSSTNSLWNWYGISPKDWWVLNHVDSSVPASYQSLVLCIFQIVDNKFYSVDPRPQNTIRYINCVSEYIVPVGTSVSDTRLCASDPRKYARSMWSIVGCDGSVDIFTWKIGCTIPPPRLEIGHAYLVIF